MKSSQPKNADNNYLKYIDQRFDEVLGVMSQFANDVNDKFKKIDDKFNKFDKRMNNVEIKLVKLESDAPEIKVTVIDIQNSCNRLMNTIDGFFSRINKYKTELAA